MIAVASMPAMSGSNTATRKYIPSRRRVDAVPAVTMNDSQSASATSA